MFSKVIIQIPQLYRSLFQRLDLLSFEGLETVSRTPGQQRNFQLGNLLCRRRAVLIYMCSEGRWNTETMRKAEIHRLSAEHLFHQPSCGPCPGPVKLHLAREANCSPGAVSTCQLTVGWVPLRKTDTFWHWPLEHFFNLMAEQDLRRRDEGEKNVMGSVGPRHQLGNLGHAQNRRLMGYAMEGGERQGTVPASAFLGLPALGRDSGKRDILSQTHFRTFLSLPCLQQRTCG